MRPQDLCQLPYAKVGISERAAFLRKLRRRSFLRHSFAVAAMDKALASGEDAYSVLPVLAEYMGHSDIKSTEYYLRLTADAMAGVVEAQAATAAAVFGGDRA